MKENVSFEILSKCPNNCLFCSSNSSMESQDMFSIDKIQNIIKELVGLSVKRICLSGGEPFLHPNLLDIVRHIVKSGIECDIYSAGIINDDGKITAIPTDKLTLLKQAGLHRIMFNFQALDVDKYDLIMGTEGRQQCLFDSIQNAVDCDIETEIHFIPMTHNVDQIDKVLAYADEHNVKQVSFLKLVNHGRAEYNGLELSLEEETEVRKNLANLAESDPKIRIGIPLTCGKVICQCHAINEKIYIKYDGSVYGCEAFKYINFEGIKAPKIGEDNSIISIISNSEYFKRSKQLLCEYKRRDNNCPVQNYLKEEGNFNVNDTVLLSNIINDIQFNNKLKKEITDNISEYIKKNPFPDNISYPLDKQTIEELSKLKKISEKEKDKNMPYSEVNELDEFWKFIITRSIKGLRFFDNRYPFKKNPEKTIVEHNIDNLYEVYRRYTASEGLFYGSSKKYRDHRLHIFRTWLIGLYVIIKLNFPVDNLDGTGKKWKNFNGLTYCEKISMWTIIAFCHDLGYPLEKKKDLQSSIQGTTKDSIVDFQITTDFSFSGIQAWNIKDIINFISTQLNPDECKGNKKYYKKRIKPDKLYNGRIQPKYNFKFVDSLREYQHGIISAIHMFKLQYFKESDFNLEQDYKYKAEDARQFYIRREILRAMASHTCFDIYNIKVTTFSSLLYLCDEIQNWGRKSWEELYSAKEIKQIKITINKFNENEIKYTEKIDLGAETNLGESVLEYYEGLYYKYKKKFRDGEDSEQRNFNIINIIKLKKDNCKTKKPEVIITISILGNNQNDSFKVKYKNCEGNDILNKEDKIKGTIFENEFEEEK
jgi:MoaA/NifB/PqqE/SkfB family radical SAM enzyme